jgi:hypothetical protein
MRPAKMHVPATSSGKLVRVLADAGINKEHASAASNGAIMGWGFMFMVHLLRICIVARFKAARAQIYGVANNPYNVIKVPNK